MQKKNKSCPFCRVYFVASAFIHDQVYCCNSPACQRESHRVASKKYRDKVKNTDEFKQQEKARVTKWRSKNPNYWCKPSGKNLKKVIPEIALRDLASSQNIDIKIALRDLAFNYDVKFKGLMSIVLDPLRDSIDDYEQMVYNRGQELLKNSEPSYFNYPLTETEHENRTNPP
jgi:hypothetical protein